MSTHFKIICRTREVADKVFLAVRMWLKERLNLDISPEKSKITNLRKKASEFLGFSIKVIAKRKKLIAKSTINPLAIKKIMAKGKELIKKIQKNTTLPNIILYNSYVLGTQNYYRIATHSNQAFNKIGYYLNKLAKIRWKFISSNKGSPDKVYMERYKGYKRKRIYIGSKIIYPMACCRTKNAMCFSKKINKYTREGRNLIHKQVSEISEYEFAYLANHPDENRSIEYNDNRISLFSAQRGKCRILKIRLSVKELQCHRIINDGTDTYRNLVILHPDIHQLIHETQSDIIHQQLATLSLTATQINLVNKYRLKVGNIVI